MEKQANLPPHSTQAEEATLGSLLVDPAAIATVRGLVQPADFYIVKNGWLAEALFALGEQADMLTVAQQMGGRYAESGADAWLAELMGGVPTALNVEHYAKIVRAYAVRRRWLGVATAIAKGAYDEDADIYATQTDMLAKVTEAATPDAGRAPVRVGEAMRERWEWFERLAAGENLQTGLSTGYPSLDRLTTGLHRQELVLIGARPGMGKSALLGNLMTRMCVKQGRSGLVFSIEMKRSTWVDRMVASEGQIDHTRLRSGELNETDWRSMAALVDGFGKTRLWIDDSSDIGTLAIRTKAAQIKAQHGLDVIGVDYTQLIAMRSRDLENRYRELGQIARELRLMARELDVAVVALAQVGRAVEQRSDKRPLLSDLRESGNLEESADQVWFLYRDEYYNADTDAKGVAEIIAAKNRSGPTGVCELAWDKAQQRYTELIRQKLL